MDLMCEIERSIIEMSRLNCEFNFTRQVGEAVPAPLSWGVDRYKTMRPQRELDYLLLAVSVYGSLARGAGMAGEFYDSNAQWDFIFRSIGQRLFFEYPHHLSSWDEKTFNKRSAKAFIAGWQNSELTFV